ncbi:MAG: cache domain-containing protein [Clostridiaceae bacterium]|nr:cache domain-containing protein [Clostridiaceae bacterium]
MFKKLKYKIEKIVISIFILGCLITGIISYLAIKTIIYYNFIDLSLRNSTQNIDNAAAYEKLIEESAKIVSTNPLIIEALKHPSSDEKTTEKIKASLNSIRMMSQNIMGVMLFDSQSNPYISENISAPPSIEDLTKTPPINNFLHSSKTSFWFLRDKNIAGYYSQSSYREKYGMLSFFTKLFDPNKNLIGYLIIDTNPNSIVDLISSTKAFSKNTKVYLSSKETGILPSRYFDTNNSKLISELNKYNNYKNTHIISSDKNFLIIYNSINNSEEALIFIVPITPLYMEFNHVLVDLISIVALLIVISIIFSILLTNSIIKPLNSLFEKMKENLI